MPGRSRVSPQPQLDVPLGDQAPAPAEAGDFDGYAALAGNGAALAALPPDPEDDGLGDLLSQLSGMLGLAAIPEVVRGGRASGAGVPALMSGGAVHLGPDVDPASPDGAQIVAHELVHVAQRQRAGSGDPSSAEREAHTLAESFARSGTMARPTQPLATSATACWELPSGVDLDWNGSVLLARRSWLVGHGLDPAGGRAPEVSRALLERLTRTTAFAWLANADPERVARFPEVCTYHALPASSGDAVIPVSIRSTIYQVIGLPPGRPFEWIVYGSSAALHVPVDGLEVGDGYHVPAELLRRAFDDLATRCGLPADTSTLQGYDFDLEDPAPASALITVTREQLVGRFGEAWSAFPGSHSAEGTAPLVAEDPLTYAESVSADDRAFARSFARQLPTNGDGDPPVIDAAMIAAWRRIDDHPMRAEILDRLHHPPESATHVGWSPAAFQQAVDEVEASEHAEMMRRLHEAMASDEPALDLVLDGAIVNHSGRLFVDQEAAFSFRTTHTAEGDRVMAVPWVWVEWTTHSVDGTEIDDETTAHRDFIDPPSPFDTSFPEVGEYVVRADVEHTIYQPASFEIRVQVQTEEARRREQDRAAFGAGPFADVGNRVPEHWEDGSDEEDRGMGLEGAMPEGWADERPTDRDRTAPVRDRAAALAAMADDDTLDVGIRDAARERSEVLDEGLDAHEIERGRGGRSFEITAAYLGRLAEAGTQTLSLVATARETDDGVHLVIRDFTCAFDTRMRTYEADAETFDLAFHDIAYTLAQDYPSGRMSVRGERMGAGRVPDGTWVGYELDCNSTWEEVRRAVWDPGLQIGVNLAATAAMVFAPATAVVIVPLLLAYNGVDTVARLWDLADSGALEATDVAIGIGELLVDIVPVAGRAARLGRTALVGLEIAEFGADLVLFSANALAQLQDIQTNLVEELAPLHQRLAATERDNPSDPELPAMRADFERLRAEAASRAQSAVLEMVAQRGLMMAASHAAGAIRGEGHGGDEIALDTDAELDLVRADFDPTQPVPREALQRIAGAMGVPVHPDLVPGDAVHLHLERGPAGTIAGVTLSVGEGATLETVLQHVHGVRAARRYQGAVGMLHHAVDQVHHWLETGHFLSGSGREALMELEKLYPAVDALCAHLENTPMSDDTRARLTAERDSLVEQIALQTGRINSDAPGIGIVASHASPEDVDAAVPHDLSGAASEHPNAHTTGGDVTRPLYADDGSFRNADLESSYQAYVTRQTAAGSPVSDRESWIGRTGSSERIEALLEGELGPAWRTRRRDGMVLHEASPGPATHWDVPEGAERDHLDQIAQWHEFFRLDRDGHAPDGSSGRMPPAEREAKVARMHELLAGVEARELSREEWAEFDRLDRELRREGFLRPARAAVSHSAEQAGMLAADQCFRDTFGGERLYPTGLLELPGTRDTVDLLYRDGEGANRRYLIGEAKTNTSELGSREIAGERWQQGTPEYLAATLDRMRPTLGDAVVDDIFAAWDAGRLEYALARTEMEEIGPGSDSIRELGVRSVEVRRFPLGARPGASAD